MSTLLFWVSSALAADVIVPVQGALTDATGAPLQGVHAVTFRLYASEVATTAAWDDTLNVSAANGAFSALLGSGRLLSASTVGAQGRFLTVEVGGTESAKVALGTAPRAALADDATALGGVAAALYALDADLLWSNLGGRPSDLTDGDAGQGMNLAQLSDLTWDNLGGRPADLVDGDAGQGLTYGGGLTLTGTTVGLSASGVGATQLGSDAASLPKVSGGLLTILAGRLGVGTAEPKSPLHVNGAIQPGADAGACDADRAGAVRFSSGRLQACNGTTWASLAALANPTLGRTSATAGASCKAIRDAEPATEDGWYWVTAGTNAAGAYQAYCDMTRNGGGWTRVVENAAYTGVNSNNQYQALAGGTYDEVRATWRAGFITCATSQSYPASAGSSPWQACRSNASPNTWSFELVRDGAVFLGAAGNLWHALPAECVAPTSATSPILCTKTISLTRESTLLSPTWYENRTNTSTSDNGGTIFVDLWVR